MLAGWGAHEAAYSGRLEDGALDGGDARKGRRVREHVGEETLDVAGLAFHVDLECFAGADVAHGSVNLVIGRDIENAIPKANALDAPGQSNEQPRGHRARSLLA